MTEAKTETEMMMCCVCQSPVIVLKCSTPEPTAPDMRRLTDDRAWFGVGDDGEGNLRLIVVCQGVCLQKLMTTGG